MLTEQKITRNALEKILSNFDIGEIKKINPLKTSGNITYIINTKKKIYLLRLSPSGFRYRSKKEIEAELELINFLTKYKISSIIPIKTRSGEKIVSWKKQFGYLREFNNGREKTNPTLKEIKKFGEWLGKFHKIIENYKTKNKRLHRWGLETTKENFKYDKRIILKSNFPNKEKFLKKFEKEISKLNFPKNLPQGTIHEDLGKRHILWKKDKIVGVIDFDRSYYGKLILDLGQACRGWCFSNDWKKWKNNNFKTLISNYQRKRKLTDLEKKYLADAIKFGILERGLSFALRFTATNDREEADYATLSVGKLLEIVESNRNKIKKILN